MQDVDDAKSDAIVKAENHRFDHRCHAGLAKEKLEAGHQRNNEAADGGRTGKLEILAACIGDEMFAVVAGVVGDA